MKLTYTAVIEFDADAKSYFARIPSISGAHTQAGSLDELQRRLEEVAELCLEETALPCVENAAN